MVVESVKMQRNFGEILKKYRFPYVVYQFNRKFS